MIRGALDSFEATLDPLVKARARALHEDQWFYRCRDCVGFAIRQHMRSDQRWDTYTLVAVIKHLRLLVVELHDDATPEQVRQKVT